MKKINRLIALLLSFAILVTMIPSVAITAFAAGYYDSTLEGVILTADGSGVDDVSVFVYDITENEVVDHYHTNTSGKWSTSECVSGNEYLVSYYHRDYTFSTDLFRVTAVTGTLTLDTVTATAIEGDLTESDAANFTYELINGSFIKITKYSGTETNVVIPETIDGYTVQAVGSNVFYRNTTIESVVLPSTVESIGSDIFMYCTNLKNVRFNDGLKTIGSEAFYGCTALADVRLPNTLTTINGSAFEGCTGLTEITLPDSITTLNGYVFENCTNLTSINYPMSLTTSGYGNFRGCTKLTSITVPEGITSIPSATFAYSEFAEINLPSTLTTIKSNAFYDCDLLEEIEIPDSLTSIGSEAFMYCTALKDIVLPDGMLTIQSKAFYGCTAFTEITLPDSITTLNGYVFENCTNLTSINYPMSLTTSGYGNFRGCTKLTSITVPEGITSIPSATFAYSEFAEINLPSTLTTIKSNAFYDCDLLEEIEIPDSLTSIGSEAFMYCTALKDIVLPDGMLTIQSKAFYGCTAFTEIMLPDSITTLNGYVFENCTNLTSINYPMSLTTSGYGNFRGCTKLTSITVPEGVTSLPNAIFAYADCLTEINLPTTLTTIGQDAFYACDGMTEIVLPENLTTIGSEAFYDCDGFITITLPDSVTTINSYAFKACSNLSSINYPKSLTTTGWCIFDECTKLKNIAIPDGVTAIPNNAFSYSEIKTISIPNTVTTIGQDAFYDCEGIVNLVLPDSITTIGREAFYSCGALEHIWIGENVTSIGYYAFDYCDLLTIHGVAGSTAETYAAENEIPFSTEPVALSQETITGQITGIQNVSVFVYDITENESMGYYYTDSEGNWSCDECISGNEYLVSYYHRDYTFSTDLFRVTAVTGTLTLDTVTATAIEGDLTESDAANFTYELINGSFIKITKYSGTETNVVIPETIDGYTVQAVGSNVFYRTTTIESVVLPSTVESIGSDIFMYCTNLKNVRFNDGLKTIGSEAFYGCTALADVRLPNTLTTINGSAFEGCTGLTEITLPDSITTLNGYVFENCTNLTSINYPMSLTTSGYGNFRGCTKLTSITVPEGITSIPSATFAYSEFAEINLPSTLTTIKSNAFYDCDLLEEIEIPDSLTSIGSEAFMYCTALKDIVLPDGMLTIQSKAFYGCTAFTEITLPDSITTLNGYVFENCTNLTSINYPMSLTTSGYGNFRGCTKLTSITVPEGVTSLPNAIFAYADCLTEINLPTTLTTIGQDAFYACDGMTEIVLPENLTTIGSEAFYDCDGFITITLPDSVTTINSYAFKACSNLSSINYPKSLTTTGWCIFDECTKLKNIAIPDGVTAIPNNAFSYSEIKTISIPNTVTTIGQDAFYDCEGIVNLVLPDSITTIGREAFYSCGALEHIWIGENVTSIGYYAFDYCDLLTIHGVAGSTAETYAAENEIPFSTEPVALSQETITGQITGIQNVSVFVYDITENESMGYYYTDSEGNWSCDECISGNEYLVSYYHRDYTFSTDLFRVTAVTGTLTLDTVTATAIEGDLTESDAANFTYELINGSFIKITKYSGTETNVVIPETIDGYTVQAVGSNVFYRTTTIESVVLPSTVESIGSDIFMYCTNLKNVRFNDGLKTIGSEAFYGCTALADVRLPNTLTTINGSAFEGCTGLTEITLPDSITTLNGYVFENCTNLTSINYPMSLTTSGYGNFRGCTKLTSITVPEGITSIPSATFAYSEFAEINLPSTLTTIKSNAFYDCDLLEEIEIPDSLTSIGSEAFMYCTALKDIVLPDGMLTIQSKAFYGCTAFTEITLPDSITTLNGYVFENCTNLTSINYPMSLTTSGYGNFRGCTKLTSITVPEGVTSLPNAIFAYADCLTEINLPTTLTTIGQDAFYACDGMTEIVLPENLTTIGSEAFYDCDGFITITLPDSVTTINSYAFKACSNLSSINYPKSLTTTGWCIFDECTKLKNIAIPDGVTAIPNNAFSYSEIKTISIPNTVTTIGQDAFYGCTNLRYIDSAFTSLTTIGREAFYGCEKLRELTLSENVTNIGYYAFDNCPVLTVFCPENSFTAVRLIDDGISMEFINNPFEDSEKLALDRDRTYYVANTVGALANGYVTMNLAYKFKEDVASDISDMSLTIRIPSNLTLIEKTLMLDGVRLTGYEFEDNVLTISLTNTSGHLSFCLNPTKDSKVTTYAVIDYKQAGVTKQEIIGVLNDDIPLLSVQADSEVNTEFVSVGGVGPADTDVSIYIDGVLADTVHTNKSGSYISKVTISEPKNYTTYTITAKATTENGDVTASKDVKYCVSSPTVQNFTMNYNGNSYNMMDQGTTKPAVTFVPGQDFNFNVKFTNPEQIDTVYVCSTRSNVTKRIEATWNETTQSYVANGLFDPSNTSYVPGTITVEYSPIRDPINFLTGNIDYTSDKYVNGASEPIKAALAGKLEDCIEDLYSDDNQISGVIKLIDVDAQLDFNIMTDIIPSYLDPDNAGAYGYEAIEDDLGVQLYLKVGEYAEDKVRGEIIDFAKGKITDFCIEGGYIDLDTNIGNYFSFVEVLGYADTMVTWDNKRVSLNESKQAILSSNMSDAEKAEALQKLDYASKANNGVVAAMALQIILGVAGVAIPFPASMILPLLSMQNENYVDGVLGQFGFLNASQTDGAQFTFRWAIDPSGYVYEGVTSNRIEGVKTTVYHIPYDDTDETFWDAPKTGKAQLWDASEWDQVNPIYTDADGKYAWDVPEGWWQVKYEKEGYETTYSEWLPVPPPQTEVNIGLVSTTTPTVEKVEVNDGSVVITFSQYIAPETFSGVVLKDSDGNNFEYTVEYSKNETDIDGNVFAKVFILNILDEGTISEIDVPETITNYAGRSIKAFCWGRINAKQDANIDYNDNLIIIDKELVNDISSFIWIPEGYSIQQRHSFVHKELKILGTGSVIEFYKDSELKFTYTVVVQGDVNGDSVCDVLDCMLVELARSKNTTLTGASLVAGDLARNGEITSDDLQAIVNKAIS